MALTQTTALEFVEVHVDGRPVFLCVTEIQRFEGVAAPKGERTKVVLKDGTEMLIDESPAEFVKTLQAVIIIRTQTR